MNDKIDIVELQNLWQSQKLDITQGLANEGLLKKEILSLRRKMVRTNLFSTSSLAIAFLVIIYVFVRHDERNFTFSWTIGLILVIIFIVAITIWLRIPTKKDINTTDMSNYIIQQIKRLERSRVLIKVSPFYGLALGIILLFYFTSITDDWQYIYYVSNITWIYIFLVSILSYAYHINRFKKEVQPIIDQLKNLLQQLEQIH